MTNITAGLLAGFVATVVLSLLMIVKTMMGIMPELDVAAMLSGMMGAPIAAGWVAHFVIGTVIWGAGFAILYDMIPGGSAVIKGIVFGIAAWLLMMILVMPMAGAGLFGMSLGVMAPVMTLVLHVIFGAVLGGVYACARSSRPRLNHPPAARVSLFAADDRKPKGAMQSERITFQGHSGHTLAARLERPDGPVRASAIFAHCFTCSKDIPAARRISARLAMQGIAVLRFDFTGLGHSEGEFANTHFTSNVADLLCAANYLASRDMPAKIADRTFAGRSCGHQGCARH